MIAGNSAARGGGLCNEVTGFIGIVLVRNSTFTGNTAPNGFGGALLNSGFNGGKATSELINSTLSGNQAPGGSGGAIYNDGSSGGTGGRGLINCTLHNNAAAAGGEFTILPSREPPRRSCATIFLKKARVAQIL